MRCDKREQEIRAGASKTVHPVTAYGQSRTQSRSLQCDTTNYNGLLWLYEHVTEMYVMMMMQYTR